MPIENLVEFKKAYLNRAKQLLLASDFSAATDADIITRAALVKSYDAVNSFSPIGAEALIGLVSMTTADVDAWVADIDGRREFESIIANPASLIAIVTNQSVMTAIAGSQTAFSAMCANSSVLSVLLASAPAVTAIAASNTAMTIIAGNATAMAAVVGSAAAMTAIAASNTAMTIIAGSATAMTAIAGNATAMAAVVGSAAAMAAIAASNTAMTIITSSATAMPLLINSQVALSALVANSAAWAKYTASTIVSASKCTPLTAANTPAPYSAAASSSSGTSYAAYFAFDASNTTYWQPSSGTTGNWILYNFSLPVHVHTVEVLQAASYFASRLVVEWSDDGSTFTAAGTFSNLTSSASSVRLSIAAAGRHQYWRVRVLSGTAVSEAMIHKLDFIGFN